MKQWLGIWLRLEHCVLVSFLYHTDSSKPDAFSQKRPSHVGKFIPLNNVCSKILSTQHNDDIINTAVCGGRGWRNVILTCEFAALTTRLTSSTIWSINLVFQDWQNVFQQLDLQVWTYKIDNMSLVFQDWQNVFQQLDLPVWTYKIEDWKTVSGVSPKQFAKLSLNSGVWSLQMDCDCLAFHMIHQPCMHFKHRDGVQSQWGIVRAFVLSIRRNSIWAVMPFQIEVLLTVISYDIASIRDMIRMWRSP